MKSSGFRHLKSRFDKERHVLKVIGREEYLLKETPIIDYKVCITIECIHDGYLLRVQIWC